MRYKKLQDKTIADIYAKKAGNVSATVKALGIDRRTFYLWRSKYQSLRDLLDAVDESLIDFTESKLLEQINEGNITAIIFHLKTKGKRRGYVEQVDNNVTINAFEALMKELPDD